MDRGRAVAQARTALQPAASEVARVRQGRRRIRFKDLGRKLSNAQRDEGGKPSRRKSLFSCHQKSIRKLAHRCLDRRLPRRFALAVPSGCSPPKPLHETRMTPHQDWLAMIPLALGLSRFGHQESVFRSDITRNHLSADLVSLKAQSGHAGGIHGQRAIHPPFQAA